MRKIIVIALIEMWTLSKVSAQQEFYSQSLQNLYNSLPETCRNFACNVSTMDTVVLCRDIVPNDAVPVNFCFDENKVFEHIGYHFLPIDDTTTAYTWIIRFIERELLTLLTTKDIHQTFVSYRENDLSILLNDKPIQESEIQNRQTFFNLLKNYQNITINFIDSKKYEVSLVFDKEQKLSFRFPADSELLTGMNKKERDIRLAVQLKNHKAKSDSLISPDYSYLQLLHDSLYVDKGSSFMIPQINNNIYYTKIDSTYNLIFDRRLLAETFANTLIIPAHKNYTINVTHRMYGNTVKKYTISSRNFNDYFRRDYDRYFGIESLDNEELTGTLILKDRSAGCIHLAFVSISINDLLNGGTMEMQLYSNIPQYNIKTLFGK